MKKIAQPSFGVEDILNTCILTTTPQVEKDAMEKSKAEIISAEIDYKDKIKNGMLFHLPRRAKTSHMSEAALLKLYEYRMLKKQSVRVYYDNIMSLVRHNRCPFCNKQVVTTVDHYLPKTIYPICSIIPINLVAACRDCNTEKDNYYPQNREEELIHPYFDDIGDARWLYVKIQESIPVVFEYFVKPPTHWDNVTIRRTEKHIEVLKLKNMYASYASECLEDMKKRLKELYSTAGSCGVKEHLEEQYESCHNNDKNSYKTALLECLMSNDWFINGGCVAP